MEKKITDTIQKVAVDVIERLMFCENLDELSNIIQEVINDYKLNREYIKRKHEYDKQLMIEKYGYYED